jgi:2-succinyl-6-hydroxy-2,4-cyclohexadiene-1-carboxylate synthase
MATLALLHGFAGQPASWDEVVAALDLDAPPIRLALPGHGLDAQPLVEDFDAAVDELALALPDEGLLAGYSLGARVALAIALRHPAKVAALLLIGVQPGIDDQAERDKRQRWDDEHAELLEREGMTAFVDRWQALPMFASQATVDDDRRAKQRRERLAHEPRALASAMRALGQGRMPSMWPYLAELTIPVQLLVGSHDSKYLSIAEHMHSLLPNSTLHLARDCGHNLLLEAPSSVSERIRALVG